MDTTVASLSSSLVDIMKTVTVLDTRKYKFMSLVRDNQTLFLIPHYPLAGILSFVHSFRPKSFVFAFHPFLSPSQKPPFVFVH